MGKVGWWRCPLTVFLDEKSWNTEQMPQRAQSTNYVGLTSQVQVQQGNHGPACQQETDFQKCPARELNRDFRHGSNSTSQRPIKKTESNWHDWSNDWREQNAHQENNEKNHNQEESQKKDS